MNIDNLEGSVDINITCATDGRGLWSNVAKDVLIIKLKWYPSIYPDDLSDEELKEYEPEYLVQVYFDKKSWKIDKYGLIYTDKRFVKSLREHLRKLKENNKIPQNMPWTKIDYTEQGMQGDDYVHMILGKW